jgi:hypothetical protein
MKLKVQRYMKGTAHTARLYLLHGDPKPGMYDYMLDRKLADLARVWALLHGLFVDERTDANAILAARVEGWKDATVSQLSNKNGFEFSADPILVAAIEEATRRALDMLFIMGEYATRYAKQDEDFELQSEGAPTGLPAIPPTKQE